MPRYLLDTNFLSEIRKRKNAHPKVNAWFDSVPASELFISVLSLGEIRKGIELLRARDPRQATVLENWLHEVQSTFAARLFPIDQAIADRWGRLTALRPLSIADSLLAATALTHDLTLVTRNTPDYQNLNLQLHNPWQ